MKKVIAKLPAKRQNLMFSATMPKEIEQLAAGILHDPAFVKVDLSLIHIWPAASWRSTARKRGSLRMNDVMQAVGVFFSYAVLAVFAQYGTI